MKRESVFLAMALAALASVVSADTVVTNVAPVKPPLRAIPLTWCALGTSITWYNDHVSSAFTKGYETRVMERIRFDGFANRGVNAGTVSTAINQVVPAGLYTIEHGVNDWGNRVPPGTMSDYENNTGTGTFAGAYRKVIDAILATNSEAVIVLCTPRKGYGFNGFLPDHCDDRKEGGYYLADYVNIVRAIATKEGFPVADFYSTCGDQDDLASLSIDVALHPNDAGYQLMADELVRALLLRFPDAPVLPAYDGNNLPATQTVLFTNANLHAIKGMSLDIQNTFGTILRSYSLSTFREVGDTEAGIYLYTNDGSVATAQFQWANGYNTTLSSAYFYGLKLRLVQVGDNIEGYVEKVVYNTSNKQYGVDITGMAAGGCTYKEEDLDTLADHNGFFTSCRNLVLTLGTTESHTVTFVDWNGTVLDTQTVAYGADAIAPANPSRANHVFLGWDTGFTSVTENLTVTALYHALYTVTFLDADGTTTLKTQTVEETTAATAPDMTGRTYNGAPFSGWDTDFSAVSGNLTVTAVYAAAPAQVLEATYAGVLPTTPTVLFPNANLLAVRGLSLDGYQKFGGLNDTHTYTNFEGEASTGAPSSGYYRNSNLFGYANSGSVLTVEFHGVCLYGSYNGIGNGFELKLTQVGSDIVGEVTWMAGFTGANDYEDSSWASQKKSNFNDWDSSSATYSTGGYNLTLFFRETESHTVTFVDWDGTTISTQTVAFGANATPPANPTRANYVFAGWDKAFTAVTENLTVTALYHQLFTVTFLDADGTTLATQTVEETAAATAPDMTGRTYNGYPFSGWDADFSSITGNLTVTAQYAEPPAHVSAAIAAGNLPANALIWCGDERQSWDASSFNWYTTAGLTTVWTPSAVAVFATSGVVRVSGPKAAGGVLFATDDTVALSGDALTLDDGSTVTLNGKFAVVSNDVSSAGAVSFVCNDVDESLRSWKGVLAFDDALLFPGASLADISNLTLRMKGKFGGARVTKNLTTEIESDGSGIHFYSASGTQISGQAKVKTYNSYGGVWEVIKFVLTEEADGIHGHVEYACGGTGNDGWTADVDMDPLTARPNSGSNGLVTAPEDDDAAWNAAPTYARAIYAISYNDANTTYIAPEVQLAGTVACTALTVGENLTVRLVGGGRLGANGTYSGDLTVNGTLAFAGDNAQTIKGKRQGDGRYLVAEGGSAVFDCGSGGSWTDLAIAGNATVNGYWTLPGDKGTTRVLPGGIVDLQSFYTQYGPQGSAPLYVYTNGLVRLTRGYSIGRAKPFHAIGGVIAEALGGTQDQLAQHVYLSNGADFIGTKVGIGDSASDWSILSVSGETPSFFSVTNLVVGLLGTVNANNKALGWKIAIEDVTGDERTDLTVRSVLQERPNTTARYAEGFRENCGLWKTGDGTVEFTAAGSCATSGVFKVEAGTVRLGEGCGGSFGALIVLGDATIDCAGGAIAFDDSTDFAWTEGATLRITGDCGPKTIRVGTDSSSLTAEQLASIVYVNASGRARPMTLSADGHLRPPPSGTTLVLR